MSNEPNKPDPAAEGDEQAIAALWSEAYDELYVMARARLASSGPLTLLDTSGLISDTFKRLQQQKGLKLSTRRHFFSYCARVMRSVIVDIVRQRQANARGAHITKLTLNTAISESVIADDEPLRVDEALHDLARLEPRLAQVVEMRYFGGYDEAEIAETLGVTERTVQRDWRKARLLLQSMLEDGL